MIGLVDYDFQISTSTSLLIPNIEIMKLATYYRLEENTFCRLISLEEKELDSYEKIYFFSESARPPVVPEAFLRANNVIYGGTGFTNNYIPFENQLIDYTIPKPSIYKEFLKQKYSEGVKAKVIEHVLDDSYYRNYAGNNKLPLSPIYPRKRVFLFDKDFFYPDWQLTIETISEKHPASILRIHPIVCKKLSQYFELRNQPKIARNSHIILDINIPLEEIPYMLRHYKNLFLADIVSTSNVFITLGGTLKSCSHYYRDYIYKLNLLYSFWSCGIPIKIRYEWPHIGVIDPVQHLSLLTEKWANGKTKNDKTLVEKTTLKSKKNIPPERAEKDTLIKLYPSAKNLFSQTYNLILQRGYWKL